MKQNQSIYIYWAIIGLLLLSIAGLVLKFIVLGTTITGEDGRQTIRLEPAERAMVLGEMRQFLAGIQGMLEAAERNDASAIAKIARPLGLSATQHVPASLVAKLPLEFKTLGRGVHSDFERIAMDAEAMNDVRISMSQLATTMKKCVACHAAYQIAVISRPNH